MADRTELTVIGINHKCSDVETREKLQISRKNIPAALKHLFGAKSIEGIVLVSTCNRIEYYATCTPGTNIAPLVSAMYTDMFGIAPNMEIFYRFRGQDAVDHLFRVVCGLESLVFGEYQIMGQVKEAYSLACNHESVDKVLHKLFHAAFRTGKKVRSETSIGSGRQSVGGMAAQLILDNSETSSRIAIIGVNENTKIIAEELKKSGYSDLVFLNRTRYKADIMAEDYGGRAHGLDYLEQALFEADVVFSCTGAPGFVIDKQLLSKLTRQERCPGLLVDMAVPRDIENDDLPDSIRSVNITGLKKYLEKQQMHRTDDLPKVEHIISNEINLYQAWSTSQSNELIEPYAEKLEMIRQQLLEEYNNQFSEKNAIRVDKLTQKLMHRFQSTFIRALIKERKQSGK